MIEGNWLNKQYFITDFKQAEKVFKTIIESQTLEIMRSSVIYKGMGYWNSKSDERKTDESPTIYIPLDILLILRKKYTGYIKKIYGNKFKMPLR
jgi:hypothetical protein